jgi:glycosyltransferase involved in cell wall biosynthesis
MVMGEGIPRVTIGIPVYNGERYLAQSIESILSQTFRDFELVISDNASSDSTERICRQYAERDPRVRYYRNERNHGAAWNHNRVVELARGEFFRWQCHDDYCSPTLLEKCLAVLDSEPDVVLCYPRFVRIDEDGRRLGVKSSRVLGMAEPYERFKSMIYRRDSCEEIYGVARTAVIRKTALIGPYSNSDDTFLAELILHGKFREVSEPLFFYRRHSAQSTGVYPCRSARMVWFDASVRALLAFPFLRLFAGYLSLLSRSPLSWRDKVRCYSAMVEWFWYFRHWLAEDIRASRSHILKNYCAPYFKRYAPWTRAIWHALKKVRDHCRIPESAAARERRLQREKTERWELTMED